MAKSWGIPKFGDEIHSVKKDTMDSGVEDTEDKSIKLYKEKQFQVIEKIKELILPTKNEQLRLITKRSFNAIAFLKYISDIETINHAIFVVYSINHEAALIIDDLIKLGKIKTATILMSNLRNKAHRKKEQLTKDLFINNKRIDLIFCSSHAKIISFHTDNNFYTIEGSGNLSYNSRVEQYIIDNDEKLVNFTKDWIEEIREYLKGTKELTEYKNG